MSRSSERRAADRCLSLRPTPFAVQHKLISTHMCNWDLPDFRASTLKEDLVANDPEVIIISLLYHLHYGLGPTVSLRYS